MFVKRTFLVQSLDKDYGKYHMMLATTKEGVRILLGHTGALSPEIVQEEMEKHPGTLWGCCFPYNVTTKAAGAQKNFVLGPEMAKEQTMLRVRIPEGEGWIHVSMEKRKTTAVLLHWAEDEPYYDTEYKKTHLKVFKRMAKAIRVNQPSLTYEEVLRQAEARLTEKWGVVPDIFREIFVRLWLQDPDSEPWHVFSNKMNLAAGLTTGEMDEWAAAQTLLYEG